MKNEIILVVKRCHQLTGMIGSLSCKVYPKFMLLNCSIFNHMQNRSFAKVCTLSIVQNRYKPKVDLCEHKTMNSLSRTGDILTCVKLDVQQKRYIGLAAKLVNNTSPKVQPYMKLMRMDKPIGTKPNYSMNCSLKFKIEASIITTIL